MQEIAKKGGFHYVLKFGWFSWSNIAYCESAEQSSCFGRDIILFHIIIFAYPFSAWGTREILVKHLIYLSDTEHKLVTSPNQSSLDDRSCATSQQHSHLQAHTYTYIPTFTHAHLLAQSFIVFIWSAFHLLFLSVISLLFI